MNQNQILLKPIIASNRFLTNWAIYLFLQFSLLTTSSAYSQDIDFESGVIIDTVSVKNSSESFALYLPKQFDQNEASSIVFIFEPVARGRVGIQPFIKAAETYNYILVCSNDSRNGPFETNIAIVDRLFETVFTTFDIDEKRIYTAGFSGGSRLATTVAMLTKKISGVIGCGAGFSPYILHKPMVREEFSYVGLVGELDMNYQEMLSVQDWLDGLQMYNELFINGDTHRWPPSEQILKAFDWLELEAFRKNLKPRNWYDINDIYERFYSEAKATESQGKIESAVWEYQRLYRNFTEYYTMDSISEKIDKLRTTTEYKQDLKKRELLKWEEESMRDRFVARFDSEIEAKKPVKNFKWWHKKFAKLKSDYLLSEDRQKQQIGHRLSYTLYTLAIETANMHLREYEYPKSLYCHKLLTEFQPDQYHPNLLIAKDYALLNMEDELIENLELAISKGFSDKDYLLSTIEFDTYRESERFKNLLEKLKIP